MTSILRTSIRKVITDMIHFFTGFIVSFNPLLALSVTLLYITYQLLEYATGLETVDELRRDLKEYTAGLVIGFIVQYMILP
jgi:hypothetical protein